MMTGLEESTNATLSTRTGKESSRLPCQTRARSWTWLPRTGWSRRERRRSRDMSTRSGTSPTRSTFRRFTKKNLTGTRGSSRNRRRKSNPSCHRTNSSTRSTTSARWSMSSLWPETTPTRYAKPTWSRGPGNGTATTLWTMPCMFWRSTSMQSVQQQRGSQLKCELTRHILSQSQSIYASCFPLLVQPLWPKGLTGWRESIVLLCDLDVRDISEYFKRKSDRLDVEMWNLSGIDYKFKSSCHQSKLRLLTPWKLKFVVLFFKLK